MTMMARPLYNLIKTQIIVKLLPVWIAMDASLFQEMQSPELSLSITPRLAKSAPCAVSERPVNPLSLLERPHYNLVTQRILASLAEKTTETDSSYSYYVYDRRSSNDSRHWMDALLFQ
jgi:hypothetical protein